MSTIRFFSPSSRSQVAFVVAVLGAVAFWLLARGGLQPPEPVVGYATVADYDYTGLFHVYRAVAYVFPVLFVLTYAVLSMRRGVETPPSPAGVATGAVIPSGPALQSTGRGLLRVLPPAALVAMGVGTKELSRHHLGVLGVAAGLAAATLVIAVAFLLRSRSGFGTALSRVNAVLASVYALAALAMVSSGTAVVVTGGRVDRWPWLPWWVTLALGVVVVGWVAVRSRVGVPPADVESAVLRRVVGTVAVFLLCANLPGAGHRFQGFDDAQSLVGAEYLRQGMTPWKDFTFIHGIFYDALRSNLGFSLFQDSWWGSTAGLDVVLGPLCVVFVFWFAGWSSRWNLGTIAVVAALGGLVAPHYDVRFIFVPLLLLVLGWASTRRWPAAAALGSALFVATVLIPEIAVVAFACVVTLLLCGIRAHRRVSWPAVSRAVACVLVILLLTGAWALLLWSRGALGSFVEYFALVGPGHASAGAVPLANPVVPAALLFAGVVLLAVATIVRAVRWFFGPGPDSARRWVMAAAALVVLLYGEKAVGRLDESHIGEVLMMAAPLLVMYVGEVVHGAGTRLRALHAGRAADAPSGRLVGAAVDTGHLATGVLVAVSVLAVASAALSLPGRFHRSVSTAPVVPRVGYQEERDSASARVSALGRVLDEQAGSRGEVFDMTNSPGYVYYLLGRRNGTKFAHVSLAVNEYGQRMLVRQLARSRPPVVLWDVTQMGLPEWDSVDNNVRHYLVSAYVLRHWVPVVRADGIQVLLRSDLADSVGRPTSRELYDGLRGPCSWGYAAAYLPRDEGSRRVDLPVRTVSSGPGRRRVGMVRLPKGVAGEDVERVTLEAESRLGRTAFTLADSADASPRRQIRARSLPDSGRSLTVPVGSCLQWHGFRDDRLYVRQSGGGPPVTSVRLGSR